MWIPQTAASAGTTLTGTYTGTVTVASPVATNTPLSLSVALAVDPGPTLAVSPDALTLGSVSNVGLFLTFIDANGNANWPFPNFATLLGQDIYYVVGTIDLLSNTITEAYSDPIRQRP